MRNKDLLEQKTEQLRGLVKNAEFHVARLERQEAYEQFDKMREVLHRMRTLLSTETQD